MNRTCAQTISLLLLFLSFGLSAQDPKLVSPDMYEVFFENDEIRIIQATYQPGQTLIQDPITYWAENIGDTVVRAVFIEVKERVSSVTGHGI